MEERLRTTAFPRPCVHILEKWEEPTPFLQRSPALRLIVPQGHACRPSGSAQGSSLPGASLNFHTGLRPCSGPVEFSEGSPRSIPHTVYGPVSSENATFPKDTLYG